MSRVGLATQPEGSPESRRVLLRRTGDCLAYALFRAFMGLLAILPRPAAYSLCEGLASLVYWLDFKHRRIGLINLSVAFPERDSAWKRRTLRKSFQQIGHLAVELSRFPRLDRESVSRRVTYEQGRGLENYHAARGRGRGILYLTAHLSAWELLPLAHALYGYPLAFVVRPLDNLRLERWATRLRTRAGNQVLKKQGSLLRAMKLIKKGGEVGFLLDQNVQPQDGVFAPLFGKPACTSSSLAALALRTSAPVLPGFIYPAGRRGHYRIRFYPPLEAIGTGDLERDLVENTARFNACIEEMIREFPHCWLWGHRRFRSQPNGRDLYKDEG